MKKIFIHIDRILTEIGRLVLEGTSKIKPLFLRLKKSTLSYFAALKLPARYLQPDVKKPYAAVKTRYAENKKSFLLGAGFFIFVLLATLISTHIHRTFSQAPSVAPVEVATPLPPLAAAATTPLAPVSATTPVVAANTTEVVSPTPPPVVASEKTDTPPWQVITVHAGDTLSRLGKRYGISAKEMALLARTAHAKVLHHLKQGQELRFYKNAAGQLQQLVYAINEKSTLQVTRVGNTYTAATQATPIASVALASPADTAVIPTAIEAPKTQIAAPLPPAPPAFTYVSGRITRSLSADARKAGLSRQQVNQLTQIFGQAKKIHTGDTFSVLYENPAATTTTGKAQKTTPPILAAQVTLGGKAHQLVRFADAKGHVEYYTPAGKSGRDALSRQPLHYTQVSSYFSESRWHPLLHYHRPHEGVDFTAPIGTPVYAAGDGVFVEVGYNGGYGRMITLRHEDGYTTRYAHLSHFASNAQLGQFVKKGQVIGYVGQTGLATGSHLHYEIRIHDVAANPLTVALPKASIPAASRAKFIAQSKIWLAELHTKQRWFAESKPIQTPQKNKG